MTETEVKIRWPEGRGDPRPALEYFGYVEIAPRVLEADQLFDRADAQLRNSGQVLRLRQSGDQAMITYKGPAETDMYKSREEIEFDVSDPVNVTLLLDRLGLMPGFRYEKFRTTFSIAGEDGVITLDETPIGVYIELEGGKSWIDATAKRLGFHSSDYITKSYAALYREFRAEHVAAPENMVF
ncbi:MAG: CYTH domain-containing protein [Bryobacteraceae bacterium]